MTDHSELKSAAEASIKAFDQHFKADGHEFYEAWREAEEAFYMAAREEVVLAMIAENEESETVVSQLASILAGVAIALKGEELPLHRHGYHDLVERVNVLMLENELRKTQNEELITAINEILRVTPIGVEAFGIAALVLGELGVSKEPSNG